MQHAQPHAAHDPFQPQAWPQAQPPATPSMYLAPMAPPMHAAAAPAPSVMGGGAAVAPTRQRLRWGRLALVFAGIAVVGVAIWSAGASSTPSSSNSGATVARDIGGSMTPLDAASDATTDGAGTADSGAASDATDVDVTAADASSADAATALDASAPAATTAPVVAAAVRGGGGPTATTGELPYTGAETWIAAILGVLVLGLGIAVQINAVRIGMTAMLYRRGILLRPIDCARLANERGLGSIRVLLSNALHRLLAEPEGNDFVRARRA